MFYQKIKTQVWFSYLMIAISAIMFVFFTQTFMQVARTLPSGLNAFALVATYIYDDLTPWYSLLSLGLNIPLVIFFWKKNSRKFMYRTVWFLLVQSAFGALYIYGPIYEYFTNLMIHKSEISSRKEMIILLPIIAAFFCGLSVALAWKFGGSSAGTDFMIYYFSQKTKKSVGSIMISIQMSLLTISIALVFGFKEDIRNDWLPILIGTFGYLGISSFIMNIVYPKYSKVVVEIHTNNDIDVLFKWLRTNYCHAFRMSTGISGHTGKEIRYITTTMLYLEFKDFLAKVKKIDDNTWISVVKIHNVFGKFNTDFVDKH